MKAKGVKQQNEIPDTLCHREYGPRRADVRHLLTASQGTDNLSRHARQRPGSQRDCGSASLPGSRGSRERDIPLHQLSWGEIYPGLAIYDTMQQVQAPISTIAVGWTASLGTVLLAAGMKGRRYALPHATVHMHPAGGGARGYAPDVEIQARELLRMQDLLKNLLASHTGQSVERITRDFDRDYFMNAQEAVEYGIIDEVLNPRKVTEEPERAEGTEGIER